MIRLLRHDDTVHREDDGAVRFDDLAEMFQSRFAGTSYWSVEAEISFLAKGGGPKKTFQYCLNPNFSNISCVSEQPSDIQEVLSFILHCKTMHCSQVTSPITSTTSGKLTTCTPSSRVDWKSPKRDRQSVFFTAVTPMYANQDQEEVQYDLDKHPNRGVQKYLECSPKYATSVQSEIRSEKRIAVLSNTIPRNRFFQQFTCGLYWENGIHEDWRGFLLQSIPIPKNTASRTHAEIASWTSGSVSFRSKNNLRPSKRTKREVRGNSSR